MRNALAVLLFPLISSLPAAAATCPGTVVFQDGFTSPNPALDVSAATQDKITIAGGKAEVTYLQAAYGRAEEYWGSHYGDANVCATFAEPATDKAENQGAGIVFWAPDYTSYYVFELQPGVGEYAVALYSTGTSGGTWTFPVAWTANAAIVKTMGSANTLRVQTKGTTATLFINDQQVGTVTGTPPAGGGQIGFYTASSTTSTSTWDVTDFSASSPQATTPPTKTVAACPGTVVFQDPFATPDPNISLSGDTNSAAATTGGKLQIQFMKPDFWRDADYATFYGDVDACASFSEPATDKAEGQVAGLTFWAADYANFYVLEINTTTGQYNVAQMSGSKWVVVVESAPSAVVAKGMGKTNTLRVETKGTQATLYVNGQVVETVTGSPPAGGGYVGFYAESESTLTATETWNISGLTIAIP